MQTIKKTPRPGRLVLLAWIAILFAGGCGPPGPQALLEGERLIRAGKYTEAVDQLELATQLLPKTAQAWNHLGLAYHGAGAVDNARKAYLTALKLDRDLAAARYNLGNLYLEQGQPGNAVNEFKSFFIQWPGSTNGLIKLGCAQIAARQWADAERSLAAAYKLAPHDPEVLNGLGLLQLQRKNTRDAIGFFNAAAQRQPVHPPALLNLAILTQQSIGNGPLALKFYRDYLAIQPRPVNWMAVEEVARRLDLELHPAPPPTPTNLVAQAPAVVPPSPTATSQLAAVTAPMRSAIPDVPPARPPTPPAPVAEASQPPAEMVAASKPEPARKLDTVRAAAQPTPAPPSVATVAPPPEPAKPAGQPAPAPTLESAPRPTRPAPTPTVTVTPAPVPRRIESASKANAVPRPKPAPPPAPAEPPVVVVKPLPRPAPPAERPAPAKVPAVQIATAKPPSATLTQPEPEASPATPEEKPKEKPGFFQRLNPMNLFRSKPLPPTPLPPSKRLASAQPPASTAPAASAGPPAPLKAPVAEPLAPAPPPPPPKPVMPRYRYLAPARPDAGDRAAAQRHFDEGIAAQQQRKLPDAIEAYRSALRADPAFLESYYNLALATLETGDLGQSLVACEYALAMDPDAANARFNFALALQRAHYPRDAADELEKLLAAHPDEARAHLTLANLYARELADPRRAREHYLKVLRLNPKHPQAATIGYWLMANP